MFWKKWPFWLKSGLTGSIIGLLLGLFVFASGSICTGFMDFGCAAILLEISFLPGFILQLFFHIDISSLSINNFLLVGFIINVISSFIVGSFFGFIGKAVVLVFGRIRNKSYTESHFTWTTVIIVIMTCAISFLVFSMWSNQIYLDEQKITNLVWIKADVIGYWRTNKILPSSLSDIKNYVKQEGLVPIEFQGDAGYEYNIKDSTNLSFELCANFSAGKTYANTSYSNSYWNHKAGRSCFEYTIDPSLYK